MIGTGFTLSDVNCWRRNEKLRSLSGKSVAHRAQRPPPYPPNPRRHGRRRRRPKRIVLNPHEREDIFLEVVVYLPVGHARAILGYDAWGRATGHPPSAPGLEWLGKRNAGHDHQCNENSKKTEASSCH